MRKEFLKRLMSENEMFRSSEGELSVILTDYDPEKKTATLEASQNGLISLNPESPQLAKTMFFGKNRDEVRRYLLSLDHVYRVDVEFSPLWVRTIPFVPEHVNVLIKKVLNEEANS